MAGLAVLQHVQHQPEFRQDSAFAITHHLPIGLQHAMETTLRLKHVSQRDAAWVINIEHILIINILQVETRLVQTSYKIV